VNWFGVTRTAQLTRVIVVIALLSLAVAVAAGASAADAPGWLDIDTLGGWYGILQAGGLLFFAFAGYARIATMGEEVRDPARTIPRAIVLALGATVLVYAAVAIAVLSTLGPEATARSTEPVVEAVVVAGWDWAEPIIRIGATVASLGALLALIAGIGRTTFAMARERDLPRYLAAVHPRWKVPHRAEVAVALIVIGIVAFADIRGAIGFSSFGVLLYYLVANLAAFRQRPDARRYPRALQVVGAAGCIILAITLPWQSVAIGTAVVLVGVLYRAVRLRLTRAA
jgi:APA family basic amino acid/polyamine antiporter